MVYSKNKTQSSTAYISSVGYYSVMMFSRQRGGRRCPDGTEQQFIFQVLVPKSILMIVNLICANLQFYFFPNIFSASVVKVIAIRMGLHGLSVRTVITRNYHKRFLGMDRRGLSCGERRTEVCLERNRIHCETQESSLARVVWFARELAPAVAACIEVSTNSTIAHNVDINNLCFFMFNCLRRL